MNQESQSKTWISCAAIAAVIIAAIIGLGMPFAERLADYYFPPLTPIAIAATATESVSQPQAISTSTTNNPEPSRNVTSCTSFENGATRKVSPNTFVIGDIIIDGISQYDSSGTGESTVAYFERESTVTAQWGAGCIQGSQDLLSEIVQGEFSHGFTTVRVVMVRTDGQQDVQYYTAPLSSSTARIENLGLWEWDKPRSLMPEPAGVGQVIFAHGDIDNSGTCHVTEFGPGIPVQGLGNGTFRLVRISGTPEQIKAAESEIQQIASHGAGGSCPWK